MEKEEGLLIKFHKSREEVFIKFYKQKRESFNYKYQTKKIKNFSDAFTIDNWKVKGKEIVIISFSESTLDYIALVTKKYKVVTEKNKLEFSHIISLNNLSIEPIKREITNFKNLFISEGKGRGKKLPPLTLLKIINFIEKEKPYLKDEIERLKTLQKFSDYTLKGKNIESLLQEREAIGSILDIFDSSTKLRKEVLSSWLPSDEKNIINISEEKKEAELDLSSNESFSFLDGIDRTLNEESTIQHDLINFGDLVADKHLGGYSTFTIGNRKLNIIYANRNNLEKETGVDLIYFHEQYNSFILVQYKLLREESNSSGFIYRPDKQMKEELLRMNTFMLSCNNNKELETETEYRLNEDGFLFKFVENKGIQLTSSELIQGLYITREYMNFILSDNALKTSRGATIISSQKTPRYLTNSEFTMLVSKGFLGTRKTQSKILKHLIKTGKTVLVAIESTIEKESLLEKIVND